MDELRTALISASTGISFRDDDEPVSENSLEQYLREAGDVFDDEMSEDDMSEDEMNENDVEGNNVADHNKEEALPEQEISPLNGAAVVAQAGIKAETAMDHGSLAISPASTGPSLRARDSG